MASQLHRFSRAAPALLAGMLLNTTPLFAQTAPSQQMARQLAESEERVRALQQRIEKLESRLDSIDKARTVSGSSSQPSAQAAVPAVPAATQVAGPPRTASVPASTQATARAAPGSFDVDEDAAQRALERTLTQTGALLLPRGAVSITPAFSYTRAESETSVLAEAVNPGTGASNVVLASQNLRRNEFTGRVEVRAGLPMDTQFELVVPYNYVRASRIDPLTNVTSADGHGFGDVTIGLAKTLLREKGALPDVIGRVSYNTGWGRQMDDQVTLGGGYRQLTGEVVALKRQDPLAFFASASYGHVFDEDGRKPGDIATLSLGTVLAASPATSLQFGFTQVHREDQEINGAPVSGSDQTYGVVSIGASSILARNVMLQTSVGIGVGRDAPDYSFNVSLPISFR